MAGDVFSILTFAHLWFSAQQLTAYLLTGHLLSTHRTDVTDLLIEFASKLLGIILCIRYVHKYKISFKLYVVVWLINLYSSPLPHTYNVLDMSVDTAIGKAKVGIVKLVSFVLLHLLSHALMMLRLQLCCLLNT